MPTGLDQLQHIVVLMMENRSFDHMLGSLRAVDPRIDGITDQLSNPDTTGAQIKPQPLADFQGQLDPDPDHHFPAVDLQIFGGDTSPNRVANMQGFIKSYFNQQRDVGHSQKIMYYFKQSDLPVLTNLALEFAVFNRWFASIPGPTICNRAFAHYGTSFGRVDMNPFDVIEPIKSIYTRMVNAGKSAKVYYYDTTSSTMEVVNLLQNQPKLFGTFKQFKQDCRNNALPQYSFIEPNYNDHDSDSGEEVANDQHPDHDVQAGEAFIAEVYMQIRKNPKLWPNTALLVVYDEHGGIYDHVVPPACIPDKFTAPANSTGTGMPFNFDRLGVRVPAILISPWIPKNTVVTDRIFDHASIPATINQFFIGDDPNRSPRELNVNLFLEKDPPAGDPSRNLLSLAAMRNDCPMFDI